MLLQHHFGKMIKTKIFPTYKKNSFEYFLGIALVSLIVPIILGMIIRVKKPNLAEKLLKVSTDSPITKLFHDA